MNNNNFKTEYLNIALTLNTFNTQNTKMEPIYVTVYENKKSGQKLITVPKDCDIEVGDDVELVKVEWVMKK